MWLMVADQSALAADRVVQIESVQSKKCLDVSRFSKKPGAQIIQYSCTGGDNQKWASPMGRNSSPVPAGQISNFA
jgi:hypothetical protein